MPRDYYIVLGIEQGASLSEIKKAYRNAIKRYHPDKTGMSTDLHKFRAAREAYEVLSDAEKRRAYDADRQPQGTPVRSEEVPKVATHRYRTRPTFPKTPLRDPFPESMIADSHRHHRYRPANGYDLYVEVTLTAREALHGGTFPLTLPVAAPCSHCFNRWGHPDVTCPVCGGYGVVRSRRSLELHLPPDLSDGTLLTVSFDPVGLGEITLLIVVRVRGSGMYFWRY